jgi:hypothetical protein
MKLVKIKGLLAAVVLSGAGPVLADEEFHGIVEKRPDGPAGTWIIGGREVAVTERTKLDEEDGPLTVGACAEVEYEGGVVKEIESEEPAKCGTARPAAPK